MLVPFYVSDERVTLDEDLDIQTLIDPTHRVYVIRFRKPVYWIGLDLKQIEELQMSLSEAAAILRGTRE